MRKCSLLQSNDPNSIPECMGRQEEIWNSSILTAMHMLRHGHKYTHTVPIHKIMIIKKLSQIRVDKNVGV